MYEFDDDKEESPPQAALSTWPETLVRVVGVIILLVGLWAGIQVLLEAFHLYRDPVRIEQLAAAIEGGSNLDRKLTQSSVTGSVEDELHGATGSSARQSTADPIRLSYFVAWVVALLLLMLITMIAFACIRTGSELVLQERQLKRNLRSLAREIRKAGQAGK